jgi:hypothetical protein
LNNLELTFKGCHQSKISSTGVILNRGKGVGLEVGKQCKVVHQGKAMVDVDTGESLGGYEEQVGIIQVTSVEGKFSKADIISGAGRIGINHYQ